MDGRVVGDSVQLLKREGERCLDAASRLVLDLEGVQSIDEAGLALLRTWSGPRLVLHGGPAYLRALLAAEGLNVS